jgi:hypothetical protein
VPTPTHEHPPKAEAAASPAVATLSKQKHRTTKPDIRMIPLKSMTASRHAKLAIAAIDLIGTGRTRPFEARRKSRALVASVGRRCVFFVRLRSAHG